MLPFIRKDLAELTAYTPHPGVALAESAQSSMVLDRLDTNECPYDLPAELKQKLAWNYQQLIETNRYPDGGHATLKEAIAQYVNESIAESIPVPPLNKGGQGGVKHRKTTITADNISVGNGSDELIRSLLIATCLGSVGSIFVAHPTFSMYGIIAQTLGIPVVSAPRKAETFEIDLEMAKKAILSVGAAPVDTVLTCQGVAVK
jgi:histidinol-phosphate aminotransferase